MSCKMADRDASFCDLIAQAVSKQNEKNTIMAPYQNKSSRFRHHNYTKLKFVVNFVSLCITNFLTNLITLNVFVM